jgi:hypothetical protein
MGSMATGERRGAIDAYAAASAATLRSPGRLSGDLSSFFLPGLRKILTA